MLDRGGCRNGEVDAGEFGRKRMKERGFWGKMNEGIKELFG